MKAYQNPRFVTRWRVRTERTGGAGNGHGTRFYAGSLVEVLRDMADEIDRRPNVAAHVFDMQRPSAGIVAAVETDWHGKLSMTARRFGATEARAEWATLPVGLVRFKEY